MNRRTLLAPVAIALAIGGGPIACAARSADAEQLVASWVELWRSYDLDRVDDLFLRDARVTYFSSEKEGLIRGLEDIREHHRGFGFVPGGKTAEQELWVERVASDDFGDARVVTAIWYFGDRAKPAAENQRGPMTIVYARTPDGLRIAHMNFGNYEHP